MWWRRGEGSGVCWRARVAPRHHLRARSVSRVHLPGRQRRHGGIPRAANPTMEHTLLMHTSCTQGWAMCVPTRACASHMQPGCRGLVLAPMDCAAGPGRPDVEASGLLRRCLSDLQSRLQTRAKRGAVSIAPAHPCLCDETAASPPLILQAALIHVNADVVLQVMHAPQLANMDYVRTARPRRGNHKSGQ
jgi:hypothetical protein